MPLLTDEQLHAIRQIIADHHAAFVANYISPSAVPPEVLERLKQQGLISTAGRTIEDAYVYGMVVAAAQDPRVQRMSLDEFREYMKRNPMPLSAIERRAMEFAQHQAAQYAVGLGSTYDTFAGQKIISAASALEQEKMRGNIRDLAAEAVARRKSVGQLVSDLKWGSRDWTRDWHRIAITELHNAHQQGVADDYAGRYGDDVRVAKRPTPDACEHCKRLHLVGGVGPPRIFKLSELVANGTNFKLKTAQWKPVVGAVHPHCQCQLIRVPADWGFDENWDLVPGGDRASYESEAEIRRAIEQEDELRKAFRTKGTLDFQGIPIAIENHRGSVRKWKTPEGDVGETRMEYAYGYAKRTTGDDEDEIDVYVGSDPRSTRVFVVNQLDPSTGRHDETKCFLGFRNETDAKRAYLEHVTDLGMYGGILAMDIDAFKRYLGTTEALPGHDLGEVRLTIPLQKAQLTDEALQKAKYLRRWRGKDGRYRYEYPAAPGEPQKREIRFDEAADGRAFLKERGFAFDEARRAWRKGALTATVVDRATYGSKSHKDRFAVRIWKEGGEAGAPPAFAKILTELSDPRAFFAALHDWYRRDPKAVQALDPKGQWRPGRMAWDDIGRELNDPKHSGHAEATSQMRDFMGQMKGWISGEWRAQAAAEQREAAAAEKYEAQGLELGGPTPLAKLRGKKVWLYHGTSSKLLGDIRAQGLRPAREHGKRSNVGATALTAATPDYVYLTSETTGPGSAQWYARAAAAKHGGDPVVVRVLVDGDDLEHDPDDQDIKSGRTQFVTDSVAPHQIMEVDGERIQKALKGEAVGGKYLRREQYTDSKGKQKWRYWYREASAAREARAGAEIRLGKRMAKVIETKPDGTVTLEIDGKRETVGPKEWHERLTQHYGKAFLKSAERRALQTINAVMRVVPRELLTDLKGESDEERLADLQKRVPEVYSRLQVAFKRSGMSPFTAKRALEHILERRKWQPEARAVAIGTVIRHREIGARELVQASENLAGGQGVTAAHVQAVADLRAPGGKPEAFPEKVAEAGRSAEAELAALSKALAQARADADKAAEALAMALGSDAIQKLALLAKAFPGLKDKSIDDARAALEAVNVVAPKHPVTRDGGETVVYVSGEGGRPQAMTARYKLVEAEELKASHDAMTFQKRKDYPEDVQERAYHRDKAEQTKVIRNAQVLDPRFVVNTNPDAVNGPPMAMADGTVLGGNSRTMSMQRLYQQHPEKATELRRYLREHAFEAGFRPEDVDALKNPVLIREVDVPDKSKRALQLLVRQMNESFTQAMDPRTMQVALGRRLTDDTITTLASQMKEDETLSAFLETPRADSFVSALGRAGVIDNRNASQYMRKGTRTLNEDGKALVARILVGRTVDNADILSETGTQVLESIARSVPYLAQAKSAAGDDYDISKDLAVAIDAFNDLQRRVSAGTLKALDPKMKDHELQRLYREFEVLPGIAEPHPILENQRAQSLLDVIIRKRGPVQMANVFREFARVAKQNPVGQATMFGARTSGADALRQAVKGGGSAQGELLAASERYVVTLAKGTTDPFEKAGPFLGPKGGLWADPEHTEHWDPAIHGRAAPRPVKGEDVPQLATREGASKPERKPASLEALRKEFHGKSKAEQHRHLFTDHNTGLLNARGADAQPHDPKRPMTARFSMEGFKSFNDNFGHEIPDGALRIMAKVLSEHMPDGVKRAGDIEGDVRDQAHAEEIAAAMSKAIDPEGRVKVTATAVARSDDHNETLARLGTAHRTRKDTAVAAGELGHRKGVPAKLWKGPEVAWEKGMKGLDPKHADVQKAHAEAVKAMKPLADRMKAAPTGEHAKISEHHAAAFEKVGADDAFKTVFQEKSGLLTDDGFARSLELHPDDHVVSADLRGVAAFNEAFGHAGTDVILREFSDLVHRQGGGEFNTAHPHGDEFLAHHADPAKLSEFFGHLKTATDNVVFFHERPDGSVVMQKGLYFVHGVGKTLDEADRVDLARNKEKQGAVPGPRTLTRADAERELAALGSQGLSVIDVGARAGSSVRKSEEQDEAELIKAGPFVGPRGGQWADPQHTVAWRPEGADVHAVHSAVAYSSGTKWQGKDAAHDQARAFVRQAKEGDPAAVRQAAALLAQHPQLRGFAGLVVPTPRSTPERTPQLGLAAGLVSNGVGSRSAALVRRTKAVESSRKLRQAGGHGVGLAEHKATMAADLSGIDPSTPILIVDDVFTSGNTIRATAHALRTAGHTGPIHAATVGYSVDHPGQAPNPMTFASLAPTDIAKSETAPGFGWQLGPAWGASITKALPRGTGADLGVTGQIPSWQGAQTSPAGDRNPGEGTFPNFMPGSPPRTPVPANRDVSHYDPNATTPEDLLHRRMHADWDERAAYQESVPIEPKVIERVDSEPFLGLEGPMTHPGRDNAEVVTVDRSQQWHPQDEPGLKEADRLYTDPDFYDQATDAGSRMRLVIPVDPEYGRQMHARNKADRDREQDERKRLERNQKRGRMRPKNTVR